MFIALSQQFILFGENSLRQVEANTLAHNVFNFYHVLIL